jgi:hypothetical protein
MSPGVELPGVWDSGKMIKATLNDKVTMALFSVDGRGRRWLKNIGPEPSAARVKMGGAQTGPLASQQFLYSPRQNQQPFVSQRLSFSHSRNNSRKISSTPTHPIHSENKS